MKITAIKQQVKRSDRYSIYIDGKYNLALSEAELAKFGLRTGQEFSLARLEDLQAKALEGKAYDRAVRYVAIRPRSRWELASYLARKGYEPALIETMVKRLVKLDLINDGQFAKAWVEYRQRLAPRSRRQLTAELKAKRIDDEIIVRALSTLGTDEELATIKEVINRKRRQPQYRDRQKLLAYLARQGYPYDLIKQAFEEL